MNEVEAKKIPSYMSCFRIFSLAGILLFSLFLNLWNNDFPLGYHVDELKKTSYILTGRQDFKHPILMLNIIRFINLFLKVKDPQKLVEMGRTVSGIFGTPGVLVFFLVANPTQNDLRIRNPLPEDLDHLRSPGPRLRHESNANEIRSETNNLIEPGHLTPVLDVCREH
ncbi:hypothetical protein ACFL35_14350 [Candidatus Riflebacteria bacterium]